MSGQARHGGGAGSAEGLREAHAHFAAYGRSMSMPDLGGCRSLGECLKVIEAHGETLARGAWVLAQGARPEGWTEGRWPTMEELDAASAGRPCVVMSFDYHSAAANTAAMEAAGLRAGVPVPPNGSVCVDARGAATGLLLEQAAYAAWRSAPEPSEGEFRSFVREALRSLAALGYREAHDLNSQPMLGPVLRDLEQAGELFVDEVWLYAPVGEIEEFAAGSSGWASERVRPAGGKLFADGTLNSRTAWMLEPYVDAMPGLPSGQPMVTPGDIGGAISACAAVGLGLAVHAIGDGAVRAVLDAWDASGQGRGRARSSRGFCSADCSADMPMLRIEHCELIDEADTGRFAAAGVVCSVQPCHLLTDIEALSKYLPHRLERVLPLRELTERGCRPGGLLWFGSDVPIVGADPLDSIQAAVERRRRGMTERQAIALAQAISEVDAWAAFKS